MGRIADGNAGVYEGWVAMLSPDGRGKSTSNNVGALFFRKERSRSRLVAERNRPLSFDELARGVLVWMARRHLGSRRCRV